MMTLAKLQRFVRMRNKSGFPSNLQFMFDLEACGMRVADLGDAKKVAPGIYVWETPFGQLFERYGEMELDVDAEAS